MPAPVCSPTRRGTACRHRIEAVAAGRFLMSFTAHGWLWLDSASPRTVWTICPWCGHDLPTPETVYERIRHRLRHEPDEGDDAE